MGPSEQRRDISERQRWLAVLAKASGADLQAAWDALRPKPVFRVLRRPEFGLVMLRGRIGGTGQPFNFGEMTMTRAAVQLLDPSGAVCSTGFGYVAGRSLERAELVARLDAMLQVPAFRDTVERQVVTPLEQQLQAARAALAAQVSASKVDFFTMVRGE
jgi:alpha-D-ribose 1-methylphosphonate 5-triphosphate synthase subunit PhnG